MIEDFVSCWQCDLIYFVQLGFADDEMPVISSTPADIRAHYTKSLHEWCNGR